LIAVLDDLNEGVDRCKGLEVARAAALAPRVRFVYREPQFGVIILDHPIRIGWDIASDQRVGADLGDFYNARRPYQALCYRTPDEMYFGGTGPAVAA
jgi:hypothetical protein